MASPYIKDYVCHSCSGDYIPYQETFPCPFCGTTSTKYFDFIPEVVNNLLIHKKEFGYFEPAQWTIRSTNDTVQDAVFHALDYVEYELKENPTSDREKQTKEVLDGIFKDRGKEYATYLKEVIMVAYKVYRTNPPIRSVNYSDLWRRITI